MLLGLLAAAAAAAATVAAAADDAGAAAAAEAGDKHVFVYILTYLVLGLSIVLATQLYRTGTGLLPAKFLGPHILYWTLSKQQAGGEGSTSTAVATTSTAVTPSSGSKKKIRKLQQQTHQTQLSAARHDTAGLKAGYLYAGLLAYLEFTDDFDYLIRVVAVIFVNCVVSLLVRMFVSPTFPAQAVNFMITSWIYVLSVLWKVEWSHQVIGTDEKAYMGGAAVLGFVVCLSLLVWVQGTAAVFNTAGAVEEATIRMAAVARARLKNVLPDDALQPVTDGVPLAALMSLLGGALAGLLMAPGIRYGRLLQGFLEPPVWTTPFKPKLGPKLLVQTGFAVQLLSIPLWVPAMADVLQLPSRVVLLLRGALLLVAGVLQAAALPHLLQAFMYSTPLSAHVVISNPALSDEVKAKTVDRATTIAISQASKVCIQLFVVPVLMITTSLGYFLSFPSPPALASPAASDWDKQPSAMLMCVAGFVGWWASTVYMFWGSLGCVLSRAHSAALT